MDCSILIIDDSKTQRQQILQTLQDNSLGNIFHEAGDGIEGFKSTLANKVDLILCDVEMPGFDGFKFLAMKEGREELKDIPVILLTSHSDSESKIRGLEHGASDYLTKPFVPGELLARVRVHLKLKVLQDELKKSNEMLRELSNTDPLTGLYNRRHMMEILNREFQRAIRTDKALSMLMIDIDHFKSINDTYGHQQGDEVLKAVAQSARIQLRPYDLIARFGGEEFAVILPSTNLLTASIVAERLRSAISQLTFTDSMQDRQITISLGVACVASSDIQSVEELIHQADENLYNAKRNGRNRVEPQISS